MLQDEIKKEGKATHLNYDDVNYYGDNPGKYKPTFRELEEMADQSRLARHILGLSVIEARALKNRLAVNTI